MTKNKLSNNIVFLKVNKNNGKIIYQSGYSMCSGTSRDYSREQGNLFLQYDRSPDKKKLYNKWIKYLNKINYKNIIKIKNGKIKKSNTKTG